MHEHIDEMGIINMNGRIYDPLIGRFMSADPYIQAPDDLQSFNRYAYVRNNPLNLTDPSGYKWWVKFREKFLKPAIAKFLDVYCGGCATILLNAYNAYWTKDANGHRLGWKGAAFSFGLTLIGGISDNPIYQAGVNMLSGCGMSAMAGGSCKKGAVDALTNEIGGPIIGGCLNARRAGESCAVGAREAATSMAGGYLAGRAADMGHGYLRERKEGSARRATGEEVMNVNGNPLTVRNPTNNEQEQIDALMALGRATTTGQELLKELGSEPIQYKITTGVANAGASFGPPIMMFLPSEMFAGKQLCCYYDSLGNSNLFENARIFWHEMGHPTGTLDDGSESMRNVNRWENPIMRQIDPSSPARARYETRTLFFVRKY